MSKMSPPRTGQVPGTRPVLLSGVHRSGTTFLTAVLNAVDPFSSDLARLEEFGDIKGDDWRTNLSFAEGGRNYTEAAPRRAGMLSPEGFLLAEIICQPEMEIVFGAGRT